MRWEEVQKEVKAEEKKEKDDLRIPVKPDINAKKKRHHQIHNSPTIAGPKIFFDTFPISRQPSVNVMGQLIGGKVQPTCCGGSQGDRDKYQYPG